MKVDAVLNDEQIRQLSSGDKPMIAPFINSSIKTIASIDGYVMSVPSYGLSGSGYDARLGGSILKPIKDASKVSRAYQIQGFEPKDCTQYESLCIEDGGVLSLEPGEFVLGVTKEHFDIPHNVVGVCTGKSTLARLGLSVLVTPLEAGWRGYLTLEFVNLSPNRLELIVGSGICQIQFFSKSAPALNYAARQGKYMDQDARPIPARF